jgi:2-dehydropantoate 2-reductase
MSDGSSFSPQSFAVVGAGPVGCIVACFLAQGGYEVTLCDVIPDLLAPALDPGIILEGAENIQHKVTRTCTHIDELADYDPDVIFITVKAHALPLIASAIEGFHEEGMAIVSWQNGIDTELELAKILGKRDVMRAVVNYRCGLAGPAHVKIPFHHPPHYIQELDPKSRDSAIAIADALSDGMAQKCYECLHESGVCRYRADDVTCDERSDRLSNCRCPLKRMHPGRPRQ